VRHSKGKGCIHKAGRTIYPAWYGTIKVMGLWRYSVSVRLIAVETVVCWTFETDGVCAIVAAGRWPCNDLTRCKHAHCQLLEFSCRSLEGREYTLMVGIVETEKAIKFIY